jgi:hypothetical protein
MKLTIVKKECYTVYREVVSEAEVDIDPKLLAQIEAGDSEEWETIQDWIDENVDLDDIDFDIVDTDEPYSELDETDIDVAYDEDEMEVA